MSSGAMLRFTVSEQAQAAPRWRDYWELTKPGIGSLVVVSAAVATAVAGRGRHVGWLVPQIALATGFLSAGAAVLNHWWEREADKLMRRTARRPLPSGRIGHGEALAFGLLLAAAGTAYLAVVGTPLAVGLGVFSFFLYVFVYTPLKPISVWNTVVGAFPGALPILIGWSAVAGTLDATAWMLFALLFVWQFPHFLAIAWLYREDYAAAGMRMFPSTPLGERYTGLQAASCCALLLAITLSPPLVRATGPLYFWGALVCGLYFLYYSLRFLADPVPKRAKLLMLSSLVYLPAVLGLFVADAVGRS